ncbi:MAG: DUF4118 domain-containing protein [Bacteroidota bacterium]|nr:DUF4118 domain-containing protein [Candidatus Kapabacteria bacterium]MDW8219309.1 DUF4118 domain-containing protein [Bacteroidota bacterium]
MSLREQPSLTELGTPSQNDLSRRILSGEADIIEEHLRTAPEYVLHELQREEEHERRGKLKIFLGMCDGVGKTYAMLHEAQERQHEGKTVVIGYIEPHNQPEVLALAAHLDSVPLRQLHDNGASEIDIDAVIAKNPDIVIIDNLAHQNATGARHTHRYEDVRELLDHGINVFTTLNVGNLESRVDTVRQITGVNITDTVPDSLLEEAEEVELIDIAPDELLKRLAEGKIASISDPEAIMHAANTCFRKESLMALREMALRLASERADQELRDYIEEQYIAETWKSGERLLVAVGPSPYSQALVRWTRRLAYSMDAPWIAVSVETSAILSDEARQRLSDNLTLARELGAEIISTVDDDLVSGIIRVAKQYNVSQIIVGKPFTGETSWWQRCTRLFRRSSKTFIDRLIEESGTIDVYVIRVEEGTPEQRSTAASEVMQVRSTPKEYGIALTTAISVAMLASFLTQFVGYQSNGMILLFTTTLLALYVGRGPVLLAGFVSGLLWNFLYIPPQYSFAIESTTDGIMFGMYFVISIVTAILTNRVKTQERAVRYREERTTALYHLAKELAAAGTDDEVLKRSTVHIATTFVADVVWFVQHDGELLDNVLHAASTVQLEEDIQDKEYTNAAWVFSNQKPAGRFTSTLSHSEFYFTPLSSARERFGVLGVRPRASIFTLDQKTLLENFVSQIASALEREMLNEEAQRQHLSEEAERLHTTLLNSIAYDIRHPLAEISLAASGLADDDIAEDRDARLRLAETLRRSSARLTHLVENLLDITRIDAHDISLHKELCDVSDLVSVVTARLRRELFDHIVNIEIPSDFPLVEMDFVLMEQALVNVVKSTVQYSPEETPIKIAVSRQPYSGKMKGVREEMRLVIAGGGPSLPSDALGHIFDKFYRVANTARHQANLGLAVAKGIIDAHNGTIVAENRKQGGLKFIITLPIYAA